MTELAPEKTVIAVEQVRLHPDVNDVFAEYRRRVADGRAPPNSTRAIDYKRWSVIYEKLQGFDTFLDVGIGMGQLVNIAAKSGRFKKVIGVDRRLHSGLQRCAEFEVDVFDLTSPIPYPKFRADVVTCLEVIEHLSDTMLDRAIDTLQFFATKKLIVTVPYHEDPLPPVHRQSFSMDRLDMLFPNSKITLIAEGARARWAVVEVDR